MYSMIDAPLKIYVLFNKNGFSSHSHETFLFILLLVLLGIVFIKKGNIFNIKFKIYKKSTSDIAAAVIQQLSNQSHQQKNQRPWATQRGSFLIHWPHIYIYFFIKCGVYIIDQ